MPARIVQPRKSALALRVGVAALALSLTAGTAAAQFASNLLWQPTPGQPAISSAPDVTFPLLMQAPVSWHYSTDQVRRFIDASGRLVQVREALEVRGDGTADSPFSLSYRGLVGGTAVEEAKWKGVYKGDTGLIHKHGAFRLRLLEAAQHNYTLVDFGLTSRANLLARRTVIFPNAQDKGIWIVDLDCQSGLPLYCAEYSSQGRLLSELEVTQLTVHGALGATDSNWGWKPRLSVQQFVSPGVARRQIAGRILQPNLAGVAADYQPCLVQITTDPLNGDQSLVLGYSDGVDEFFVIQAFQALDPFPSLASSKGGQRTHAVATYDTASQRVFVFHDRGVNFMVVGSNSLHRLKDVARRLCLQAVATP